MTSSDSPRFVALRVLDHVSLLLAEDRLSERIDEQIDAAAREFTPPEDMPRCSKAFHRVLGRFLQAIAGQALPGHLKLSLAQAQDEVVALLEEGYRSADSGGYHAALLDAIDPERGGLSPILAALADLLKQRQRDREVRYVMGRLIDSADWQTQCEIAAILLRRCEQWLPPELARCAPARMVDQIGQLLVLDMAAQQGMPGLANPLGLLT